LHLARGGKRTGSNRADGDKEGCCDNRRAHSEKPPSCAASYRRRQLLQDIFPYATMSCLWENSRTRPSALFLQSAHLRRRRDLDRLLPWPAYCPPARRHHAQRAFLIGHIVAHRFSGVKLSLILSLIALIPACLDGGMACTLQIRAPVGPLAAARLGAAGRPRAFARRCASTPP